MSEFSKALNERFLLQKEYLGNNKPINKIIPLVSITIATYQHRDYIKQCLDGVLMQVTTFPYEIIIGEDGSIDGTQEICIKYAEQHPDKIRLFIRDRELSQFKDTDGSIKRFNGIWNRMSCRGKYIAWCEGDDYWTDPYKLQKQVDFLESSPNYSMCFHKAEIINELERDIPLKSHKIENRDYSGDELFCNWIVPTASMVFKREVINYRYKGQERMLNGDINLVLTCAMLGKIRGFNEAMSVYRMQSTGVTYDKKLQRHRALKYPDHYLYIKDNFSALLNRNTINKSISQAYFGRIFVQDDFTKKIIDLLLSFYYHPVFAIKGLLRYIHNKVR